MSNSAYQHVSDIIRRLKPGQRVKFSPYILSSAEDRPSGAFSMAVSMIIDQRGGVIDRILDGIVGSAYEFGHYTNVEDRCEIVYRLATPLPSNGTTRTHVSMDRRQHYRREYDRYELIEK